MSNFRSIISLLCATGIALILTACNRQVVVSSSSMKANTDECATARDICDQAEEFQKEYEKLPEEERKDMIPVLSTYTEHCAQAQEQCKKSQ